MSGASGYDARCRVDAVEKRTSYGTYNNRCGDNNLTSGCPSSCAPQLLDGPGDGNAMVMVWWFYMQIRMMIEIVLLSCCLLSPQ